MTPEKASNACLKKNGDIQVFSDITQSIFNPLEKFLQYISAHYPRKTCDGEGFVGKDCKCWCKGTTDPEKEPVIECDVTPTPLPVSPSPLAPAPVISQGDIVII